MEDDQNDQRLRELVAQVRAADAAHTPSFERLWLAASRRQAMPPQSWRKGVPKLALRLAAVLLLTYPAALWVGSKSQHRRQIERDLIALDSALLTHWQAPTDVLLDFEAAGQVPSTSPPGS